MKFQIISSIIMIIVIAVTVVLFSKEDFNSFNQPHVMQPQNANTNSGKSFNF